MMNMKVGIAAMALAMMGWFCSSAVAADAEVKELNFGVISTESTANLKKGFDPFLNELEKKLGIKVNAFFAPDYAGVIEGMRFKKVDFAWFGNKSAIEAVDRAGGEVFAQTVGKDGNLGYQSLIIVHKDSPLNSIDDIITKGKELNFGNGDPNSTSGYLIPSYYLWAKKNVDPKKHFKTARSANHESNVMAVATKQVDFATNNTENMAIFEKSNPDQFKDIKIIRISPDIPTDPIVWRKDLPREVKAKILSVFLGFGRIGDNAKAELTILNNVSSGWGAFLPSDNSQLLPIRELEIAKNIQKMEGDEKINAGERSTRLAKLTEEQKSLAQHIELSGFWNSKKHN